MSKYESFPLSRDHKPELTTEKERILSLGGRVDRYENNGTFIGPYRVWCGQEAYPGIAMSRSIGDLIASSVGVICEPGLI